MQIAGVREFRDHATRWLRSPEPVLVLRRGRVAGLFFPWQAAAFPLEFKRELYASLSREVARQFRRRRLSPEALVEDFNAWRKRRRGPRRRR